MQNKLNIVLLEPQIPQNTGNIVRTCAVTGSSLHLIRPLGFQTSDKYLKRAGLDYWDKMDITYYDNMEDFYNKAAGSYYYFTSKGLNNYCDVTYEGNIYLIFGREDAGLPEELLYKNKKQCVRIPMVSEVRCLNLGNSVAIATYEVQRQWAFDGFTTSGNLTKFSWN